MILVWSVNDLNDYLFSRFWNSGRAGRGNRKRLGDSLRCMRFVVFGSGPSPTDNGRGGKGRSTQMTSAKKAGGMGNWKRNPPSTRPARFTTLLWRREVQRRCSSFRLKPKRRGFLLFNSLRKPFCSRIKFRNILKHKEYGGRKEATWVFCWHFEGKVWLRVKVVVFNW